MYDVVAQVGPAGISLLEYHFGIPGYNPTSVSAILRLDGTLLAEWELLVRHGLSILAQVYLHGTSRADTVNDALKYITPRDVHSFITHTHVRTQTHSLTLFRYLTWTNCRSHHARILAQREEGPSHVDVAGVATAEREAIDSIILQRVIGKLDSATEDTPCPVCDRAPTRSVQ